ncbi:MAG: hypothetical protein GY737_30850, partial [Desulfobacteraceae bacterium]|nr:hypothetical protein [Desulfobacteraceae bacterium]
MTILIHIASGGLGTSATQIVKNSKTCQAATIGSRLKWVHATGNNIPAVGNSRKPTFSKQWPNFFSNVLNSLTSLGYIDSSLYSMEKNSFFTEVGKNDIWSTCKMTSSSVSTEASIVALEQECGSRGSGIPTLCLECSDGTIHAAVCRKFLADCIGDALAWLRGIRSIGKIVLSIIQAMFSSNC